MRSHSFLTPVAALSERSKIWLAVLIFLALVLLFAISPRLQGRVLNNTLVVNVLARSAQVISYPFTATGNFVSTVKKLRGVEEEYRQLKVEYESLLFLQSYAQRLEEENRVLRDLLQYRVESPENFASRQVARVLARAKGSFAHNVIVNVGAEQGVKLGGIALHRGVLLGVVTALGTSGARVRLLRDPQSRVAIKIEGSSKRALLAGRGARRPFLLFARGDQSIKVNARVFTSGEAGVLPPDLEIGYIASSGGEVIEVELKVDVDSIEKIDIVGYEQHSGDIDKTEP